MPVSIAGLHALPKASADAEDALLSDGNASSDSEPAVAAAAALSAADSLQRSLSVTSQPGSPQIVERGGAAWAGSDWAGTHNDAPEADVAANPLAANLARESAASQDEAADVSASQAVVAAAAKGPGKCADCNIKCEKNWFRCVPAGVIVVLPHMQAQFERRKGCTYAVCVLCVLPFLSARA